MERFGISIVMLFLDLDCTNVVFDHFCRVLFIFVKISFFDSNEKDCAMFVHGSD